MSNLSYTKKMLLITTYITFCNTLALLESNIHAKRSLEPLRMQYSSELLQTATLILRNLLESWPTLIDESLVHEHLRNPTQTHSNWKIRIPFDRQTSSYQIVAGKKGLALRNHLDKTLKFSDCNIYQWTSQFQ